MRVLLVLTLVIFGRLLLHPDQYVWFDHWDMCQLEIPRATFVAYNLQHEGHFPLWDPNVWSGLPVLGSAQPGPLFPLTLLLELLPLENGRIRFLSLNGVYVLQRLLMGYLALLLFREIGAKRWAAAVGGVLFAAGGYAGSLPWLDISNAVLCTPAIARFALRLSRDPRSTRDAAWLGFWLGLCWLSGHHEIPLLSTYAVLGFFAGQFRWIALPNIALSLAIGAAISCVQTLPLLEFGRQAKRWIGLADPVGWGQTVPYEIHERHSLHWRDLLTILYPGATPESHTTMFLGVAVTTLALWGAWTTWRSNRVTQGLSLAAGLSLVFSLGANTPLHHALYLVLPAIDKARTPARGLFLFALAISALATIGLGQQTRWKPFLALVGVVAGATFAIPLLTHAPGMYGLESSHYLSLAFTATLLLAASCLPGIPSRLRPLLPATAIVLELATVSSLRVSPLEGAQSVCAADLNTLDALADDLRSRAGKGGRVSLSSDFIRTSLGDQYRVPQFASFVAGVPAALLDLDLFAPRTQRLLGVNVAVAGERPDRHAPPRNVRIVEQPALPPAWVSHTAIRVANAAELRAKMADESVALPATVLLMGDRLPELSNASDAEPVRWESPNPDHIVLRFDLKSRGVVTTSGVDYPGWNATIDGRPATILRTYGALRGVVAEAGAHTVEFRYQPASVRAGPALSLLGFAAVFVILIRWGPRS